MEQKKEVLIRGKSDCKCAEGSHESFRHGNSEISTSLVIVVYKAERFDQVRDGIL